MRQDLREKSRRSHYSTCDIASHSYFKQLLDSVTIDCNHKRIFLERNVDGQYGFPMSSKIGLVSADNMFRVKQETKKKTKSFHESLEAVFRLTLITIAETAATASRLLIGSCIRIQ